MIKNLGFIAAVLLAAITVQNVNGETLLLKEKKSNQQESYHTYRGKVVDSESGAPLIFATISVQGTNLATVTNIDGEFSIKVPTTVTTGAIEISYLGYNNKVVPFSDLKNNGTINSIKVSPAPIPIQEVTIKPITGEEIVTQAIRNFELNYSTVPNMMSAFYRETVKKGRNYVAIGEAVVEVFKAPYNNEYRPDAVKIYKGRRGSDVSRMDTVLFKLQGGPVTSLQLDIVKNPEAIITMEAMQYYDYSLISIVMIDDNPHYMVEFAQKEEVLTPLYFGKMFIDTRSFALKEMEFSLNLENIDEAKALFIRKKPLGVDVVPEQASYKAIFKETAGKWYFAYSRAEVRFNVSWKKRLFNSTYTTMSEIAITDRTTEEVIKFAGAERVKYTDVFSDKVSALSDPDYWGDYNVIEPDQSIESAIRRLSRKLRFNDDEK